MRTLKLAATQMTCGWDWEANLSKAESLVRNAAQQGAQVILIQELFEGPYFCKDQKLEYFERAYPLANHPAVQPGRLQPHWHRGRHSCSLMFYGSSFITGPLGELRQQAGSQEEAVLVETFDLDEIQTMRRGWGLFRDRRPGLYGSLLSLDGSD